MWRAPCSRTLGRTGKRQSEVNRRRLPICTLEGRRSIFNWVHWLGWELMDVLKASLMFLTISLSAVRKNMPWDEDIMWHVLSLGGFYIKTINLLALESDSFQLEVEPHCRASLPSPRIPKKATFHNIQLLFPPLIAHLCLKLIVVGAFLSCVARCCKPHTMQTPRCSRPHERSALSFDRRPSVMSRFMRT